MQLLDITRDSEIALSYHALVRGQGCNLVKNLSDKNVPIHKELHITCISIRQLDCLGDALEHILALILVNQQIYKLAAMGSLFQLLLSNCCS